jgi:hypothetical protein
LEVCDDAFQREWMNRLLHLILAAAQQSQDDPTRYLLLFEEVSKP